MYYGVVYETVDKQLVMHDVFESKTLATVWYEYQKAKYPKLNFRMVDVPQVKSPDVIDIDRMLEISESVTLLCQANPKACLKNS